MTITKQTRLKVQVWIYLHSPKEGRYYYLLLLTRPERGSFWQPVTGSVDEGEGPLEAALREAQEESGLSFGKPLEDLKQVEKFVSRGVPVMEYGYALQASAGPGEFPQVRLDTREHSAYKWVLANEVPQMLAYESNTRVFGVLKQKLGE